MTQTANCVYEERIQKNKIKKHFLENYKYFGYIDFKNGSQHFGTHKLKMLLILSKGIWNRAFSIWIKAEIVVTLK